MAWRIPTTLGQVQAAPQGCCHRRLGWERKVKRHKQYFPSVQMDLQDAKAFNIRRGTTFELLFNNLVVLGVSVASAEIGHIILRSLVDGVAAHRRRL